METPNLSERDQQVLGELHNLAERHVSTDPRLVLLPVNPTEYPGQSMDTFVLHGDPQHSGTVEAVASTAERRFPEFLSSLKYREARQSEVSRVGELLKGGNNVAIVTNHGDLIDIALAQAAIYSELDNKGYKFRSSIMISKMVSMLGFRLGEDSAPCAEILKILCHDVFLSFPRTESMQRSGISRVIGRDPIDRYNRKVREDLGDHLQSGGTLLAMAPSGTTDKPLPDEPGVINLAPLSAGTIKLMRSKRTYVLPVAVWLQDKKPVFEICDIPRLLESDEAAHRVMVKISKTLNENVADRSFMYYPKDARELGRIGLSEETSDRDEEQN